MDRVVKGNKYGVASCDMDIQALRNTGVADNKIYYTNQSHMLLKNMAVFGDCIYTPSIKSLAIGAYDLFSKMSFMSDNGIEFRVLHEKYLSFSASNPLSNVIVETLRNLSDREQELIYLIRKSSMNENMKEQLISRIMWENITNIRLIFRNNGIRKKGH